MTSTEIKNTLIDCGFVIERIDNTHYDTRNATQIWYDLDARTDSEIQTIWSALNDYNPKEMYNQKLTMEDWAQIVYSQMSKRGLRAR